MAKITTTGYQNFVAYYVPSQIVKGGCYITVMKDESDAKYYGPDGKQHNVSKAAVQRGDVVVEKQPEIENNLDSKGKHTTFYSSEQLEKMLRVAKSDNGPDPNNPRPRFEIDPATGRNVFMFRAELLFNKKGSPVVNTSKPILKSTNARYSALYACNAMVGLAQTQARYDEMQRKFGNVLSAQNAPETPQTDVEVK